MKNIADIAKERSERMNKVLQAIQNEFRAGKDMVNDYGGFKYRNVESMLTDLKPILKKHDAYITFLDDVIQCGDRFYIEATVILHTTEGDEYSKALAREQEVKKGMDAAQITGACSTYARKYALCGLMAVDDNRNDPDSQEVVDMIDKRQVKMIVDLAEKKGSDLSDICDYFKVGKLEEMTAEDYAKCLTMLTQKGDA